MSSFVRDVTDSREMLPNFNILREIIPFSALSPKERSGKSEILKSETSNLIGVRTIPGTMLTHVTTELRSSSCFCFCGGVVLFVLKWPRCKPNTTPPTLCLFEKENIFFVRVLNVFTTGARSTPRGSGMIFIRL